MLILKVPTWCCKCIYKRIYQSKKQKFMEEMITLQLKQSVYQNIASEVKQRDEERQIKTTINQERTAMLNETSSTTSNEKAIFEEVSLA